MRLKSHDEISTNIGAAESFIRSVADHSRDQVVPRFKAASRSM